MFDLEIHEVALVNRKMEDIDPSNLIFPPLVVHEGFHPWHRNILSAAEGLRNFQNTLTYQNIS